MRLAVVTVRWNEKTLGACATQCLRHYIITRLAVPKKAKKPTTSVTVVNMTEPANAGSNLNLSNVIGIRTPNSAAVMMLIMMAREMVAPKAND